MAQQQFGADAPDSTVNAGFLGVDALTELTISDLARRDLVRPVAIAVVDGGFERAAVVGLFAPLEGQDRFVLAAGDKLVQFTATDGLRQSLGHGEISPGAEPTAVRTALVANGGTVALALEAVVVQIMRDAQDVIVSTVPQASGLVVATTVLSFKAGVATGRAAGIDARDFAAGTAQRPGATRGSSPRP